MCRERPVLKTRDHSTRQEQRSHRRGRDLVARSKRTRATTARRDAPERAIREARRAAWQRARARVPAGLRTRRARLGQTPARPERRPRATSCDRRACPALCRESACDQGSGSAKDRGSSTTYRRRTCAAARSAPRAQRRSPPRWRTLRWRSGGSSPVHLRRAACSCQRCFDRTSLTIVSHRGDLPDTAAVIGAGDRRTALSSRRAESHRRAARR
jgi:hypothetical protein